MTLKSGTNLGLLVSGAAGEAYYAELLRQWRGLDALIQPSVIARVAAVPTTGMVDGDRYLLTTAPNANTIARYSADSQSVNGSWEYFTPKDGWLVWSSTDQLTYRFKTNAWVIHVNGMVNPLTTVGDMLTGGTSGNPARLPIGTNNQIMAVVASLPTWIDPPNMTGMPNPMTALGDIVVGGAAGAPIHLPVGAPGQVLTMVSGQPTWAASSGGSGGSATSSCSVVASEALAAGDLVNIWNNAGTAYARKASASAVGKHAHGFVMAIVTLGAAATVYFVGSDTNVSGLNPGTQYLSTTAGKSTDTPPSASGNVLQTVGFSTATTVLNFQPMAPVVLA